MGRYQKKLARFKALKARVIAISVDDPAKQKALKKKLGVTYPILSDQARKVVRLYKLHDKRLNISKPATLLIDDKGVVRWMERSSVRVRPASETLLRLLKSKSKRQQPASR